MAGKITTNSVVLGDSITDTQNFVLKTNADGTATLARGALGGLGTVFGVNGSGALTGATLVSPTITGLTAAALPAGSVLQVVQGTTNAQISNGTSTLITTGLTATITPKFATSKILVFVHHAGCGKDSGNTYLQLNLYRGASSIHMFEAYAGFNSTGVSNFIGACSTCYLDSPATTSATSYTTYYKSGNNVFQAYLQVNNAISTITLMEIAV